MTYSAGQGLPAGNASLLAARDATVWVSTTAGLKRWRDGRLEQANVRGLPQMRAASLFQDSRGRIWIGSHTGVGFVENEAFAYIAGVPGGFIDSFAEDKHGIASAAALRVAWPSIQCMAACGSATFREV